MNDASPDSLAQEWIKCWSQATPPAVATGEFGGSALDWDLPRDEPQLCWDVILEVLKMIEVLPSNRLLQVLAAGPMEDLMGFHGDNFIARVEAQAASDQKFNVMLGGVWQGGMTQDVWNRLQKCCGHKW